MRTILALSFALWWHQHQEWRRYDGGWTIDRCNAAKAEAERRDKLWHWHAVFECRQEDDLS